MEGVEMKMLNEFNVIIKHIFPWIAVFFISFILTFSLGLSSKFFLRIKHDLLPNGMQLIVTNPMNALLVQIEISLFLSFLISLPYLLYKIISYISPALYRHEKKTIIKAIIPSVSLFVMGALFAYFVLIPATFKIMNFYVLSAGVIPFFEINEFVSMVIAITLGTGIMFLLPVFMKILNMLGLVDKSFWIKNFKYALIVFLIFSAIITPDGTGITMLMLSLPLTFLYFVGYFFSKGFNSGGTNK